MKTKFFHCSLNLARRLVLTLRFGLAILVLGMTAQAQIAIQDGNPLTIQTVSSATINYPSFTVTAGASVLVVIMEDKNVNLPEPATLAWNGQTLTRDVQTSHSATTDRSVAIYHLFNPTPGTSAITGTMAKTGVTQVWLTAFTLSGVSTSVAPITGAANSGAGSLSTLSISINGVVGGSWAAVADDCANTADTIAITSTTGMPTTAADYADGGTGVAPGYVAGLSPGAAVLTYTAPGSAGAQKCNFAADVFAPLAVPTFPPAISVQPSGASIFTKSTAVLSVVASGTAPLSYLWYTNNTASALSDIASHRIGSTSNVLTISTAALSDTANYTVVVTNAYGSITSSVANVSVVVPNTYEAAALANGPIALYPFNETNDPSTGTAIAFDAMGAFNGVYSANVLNGFDNIYGPQASVDNLPGFPNGNFAAEFTATVGQQVTLPALNLNTNTVTFTAWINPAGVQPSSAGLVFWRGSSVAGLCFANALVNGQYALGYNWNNDANTYNWPSGLNVPLNTWSLVALAVSPTAATLYIINTNGLVSATHTYAHPVQAFNSTSWIGFDNNSSTRVFNGIVDDVAIYNSTLTQSQMLNLFAAASGISYFPVTITSQPQPQTVFAGESASFTVAASGSPAITYQWYKNSTPLANGLSSTGSTVLGATNSTLNIGNVSAGDVANYYVSVGNLDGSVSSSTNALSLQALSGEPYEAAVVADSPVAFYEFNETNDPSTGTAVAYDYTGGYNGLYGTSVENGNPNYNIQGPQPSSGFPGFSPTNLAAQFVTAPGSLVTLPAWNLNTNNWLGTTMTAWINPNSTEPNGAGIVFSRAPGTIGGLNYVNFLDANGNRILGYAWNNNDANTWGWNSGLIVPQNQWSLVVLTVTPTNATIYVIATNGFNSATHVYNHVPQTFNGTSLIGDGGDNGTGASAFSGTIDDVAVFNRPLSASQALSLFSTASGIATFAPDIADSPTNETVFTGQTVQLLVGAGGTQPLDYQWMAGVSGSGVYTNVVNGGNIYGATNATLTISNVNLGDFADYIVVVTNMYGAVTSSVPATLTVEQTQPAMNITLSIQEPAGDDWNTVGQWTDGQGGLPASVSTAEFPGSTYEVLPGALLRTPLTAVSALSFPGGSLQIDGNGVWINSPAAGSAQGEMRLKEVQNQTIGFPLLIMNGGQIDNGNTDVATLAGTIDIVSNTPIYVDSSGAAGRVFNVSAGLTGNGSIEYIDFDASLLGCLDISGPTNTYTGTWDVVQGPLLGAAANSLGTNSIAVGTSGALETLYDIDSPGATLALNGVMYLHQNDTFNRLMVDGVSVAAGVYSHSQLATAYPANFPATWTAIYGSTVAGASGSITVLSAPTPVTITVQTSGPNNLQLSWPQGILLQATNLAGPWTAVTGAVAGTPYQVVISPATPGMFFKVQE